MRVGARPNMHAYKRLFAYTRPYGRRWVGMILVTAVSTAAALLQPWPLKVLVDHVLGDAQMPEALATAVDFLPGGDTRTGLLGWVVLAGLVIFAVDSLADAILTLEWTRVGRRMVYDLARDLFARVQRRSLMFHAKHSVGDSMSRITEDAWCVHTVVDALLFGPGQAVLTALAMIVVMVQLDPPLTVLALSVAPLMAGAAWLFGGPIRSAAHARRDSESRIHAHVQQTLAAVPVVQAFTREEHEERRFQEHASIAIRAQQRSAFVGGLYGLGSGLLTTAGTAVVLWMAAMRVLDAQLTIGGTLVFLSYLHSLQAQLAAFTNIYATVQDAGASIDRVNDLLDEHEAIADRPEAPRLPQVKGDVVIEHAVFGYVPGRPVLRGITIGASAGETIAIVGTTGAGKSTLVSLIPRFIDPLQGRVLIDGWDLRDVQLASVRAQVAVVLQEAFLFPISVADNIVFGRAGATRTEIESAARAANAHTFITQLPAGYDTVLGERGSTLSGGERQRIAIARAILKDAPILILDEPTSALDAETERALLDALEQLMRGRTTFVIAHRLSTIRSATRIVVLEQGEVVEQGTHAELLATGGRYCELRRLQFGGSVAGTPAA